MIRAGHNEVVHLQWQIFGVPLKYSKLSVVWVFSPMEVAIWIFCLTYKNILGDIGKQFLNLCMLPWQERYRQDCNLAVQLLKCNKSHFRNHKFADVSGCLGQGRRGWSVLQGSVISFSAMLTILYRERRGGS